MKIIKRFIVPIFIIVVATVLVIIWFHEGFILGVAEAEIPFHNLQRFEQETAWAWTDFNLGTDSGLTVASHPSWWFLAQIQDAGVPGFIVQAFTFWFLLFSAGIGIYLLGKLLFPDLGDKYLFLAVLFYYFNPLSLVSVWNRFLYNYMVFWALLPIALYFFIKGLQERKLIFSVILGLILTLFSYALTGYVFNLLIWFALGFTWLFFVVLNFEKKFTFFSIKFFVLTFVSFALFNAWWLMSALNFVTSSETTKNISSFAAPEGNLYTLNILSRKLGNIIDITSLMQSSFYQQEGPDWASFYNLLPVRFLLFAVSGLILWGIYKLRSQKAVLYLGLLFLINIFLAKGNNPPFGEVFQFFFMAVSFLQILRNPFEKFSFLIALPASLLLAVSVWKMQASLKFKFRSAIYPVFLVIVFGVFGYPFFTGLVFTSKFPPNDDYSVGYKVKVPDYYKQADDWLSSQGHNFRFIGFPLGDEGITYKWEKGYQGVESSRILFSTPGITFNTTIPYYSQIADKLEKLLFQEKDFYKVANLLNVRYFLVHSDVDTKARHLRDPQVIETFLNENQKEGTVKKVTQFDKLTLWENLKWFDKTVYAATNLMKVFPQAAISDVLFANNEVNDQSVVIGSEIDIKSQGLTVIYPEEEKGNTTNQAITPFEHTRKYRVNIDKQSDYEFVLSDVNLAEDEATIAAQIRITIDNKPIDQGSRFMSNNKISFGRVNLSAGMHEISIDRPMSQNLISVLSIPENIIIQTNQGKNQILFEIENFDPYARYQIGFDYLIKLGQEFMFIFQQNNESLGQGNIVLQYPYYNVLTQGGVAGFIHASGIFTPQRVEKAGVLFWADPNKNSEVVIKNITVNRLIEPQPVLIKENPQVNTVSSLPQITYTKHNPTKYSVHIGRANNPFILVLSELFNSGWEARFDDNTIVKDHFLANAYANGWLIDKTGDFNLTLEFAPQRLLDIGKVVSIVSFLAGLIYIGSIFLKKKRI